MQPREMPMWIVVLNTCARNENSMATRTVSNESNKSSVAMRAALNECNNLESGMETREASNESNESSVATRAALNECDDLESGVEMKVASNESNESSIQWKWQEWQQEQWEGEWHAEQLVDGPRLRWHVWVLVPPILCNLVCSTRIVNTISKDETLTSSAASLSYVGKDMGNPWVSNSQPIPIPMSNPYPQPVGSRSYVQ